MNPHIITLPTGEAIAASAIVAVRKADKETLFPGTASATTLADRVIIDFGTSRLLSTVVYTDTPEERDTLAASIIEQWKSATP